MDIILLFLGLVLLTIGMAIVDFSTLLRLLGFKEESLLAFQDAMAISVLAFALLTMAQPTVVYKPPGSSLTMRD